MNPIAACLVGHEDWGKSETLYHLVGRSRHKAWIVINNTDLFVRHMSNDDQPVGFINFIETVTPTKKQNIVLALCPNFSNPHVRTEYALNRLRDKGYSLHFWVMKLKYDSPLEIKREEIDRLREYGGLEIYSIRSEANDRARAFENFLSQLFHA